MSVRCIWPFRSVTRELGIDFDSAWASVGVGPDALSDPETRVSVRAAQRRARFVVEATGARDYGVRAAVAAEAGLFDLPEYAARCQQTLGGAVECLVRFVPLMIDAGSFTAKPLAEGLALEWLHHPRAPLDPVSVEFLFGYMVLAARRFTGIAHLLPHRVQLRHEKPPDIEAYGPLFGTAVEFSAPVDAWTLSTEQLQLPLRQADSHLGLLLDRVASHLLAQKAEPTARFSDQIRRLVTKHVSTDGAPVVLVAEELGITPRTLHRRLAEEGTTYRDLADEVRKELALAYLEAPDLSIGDVAYLLGFSGVQAFHRAFKRWTGQPPGAYRKER